MRTTEASGGTAAPVGTVAFTDVKGQALDLASDLEREEAVTSLSAQAAMGVVDSFATEGSKQALSLGFLMAQKKLQVQDVKSFDSNEAYSSFPKGQQEQLLKDLLTIELARNVLSNLVSARRARLRQRV